MAVFTVSSYCHMVINCTCTTGRPKLRKEAPALLCIIIIFIDVRLIHAYHYTEWSCPHTQRSVP